MNTLTTFRHEFKYNMTAKEEGIIKNKLSKVLKIDRDPNGYMVRSLYFDSIDDIDLNEKLIGALSRKKIRLRIYETNPQFVKLELKNKYDINQLKESIIISMSDAKELIKGNYSILLNYNDNIATKIYTIMREYCYIPKVIIEYKRLAFITQNNTRITIDSDIRKSYNINDFFNEHINYDIVSDKNTFVLEVKFNEFLESYIKDILSSYVGSNVSVSKYLISRED